MWIVLVVKFSLPLHRRWTGVRPEYTHSRVSYEPGRQNLKVLFGSGVDSFDHFDRWHLQPIDTLLHALQCAPHLNSFSDEPVCNLKGS